MPKGRRAKIAKGVAAIKGDQVWQIAICLQVLANVDNYQPSTHIERQATSFF